MDLTRPGLWRLAGAACFAAALGGSTAAYTASSSVADSPVGFGSAAVTGYAAGSVRYELSRPDPSRIDSVAFTLDAAPPAGSTIRAQLVSGGAWFDCDHAGTAVTCRTPGAPVDAADRLTVAAAD